MSDHFLGLEGAATINTRCFALTQRAVADLVDALAMGAFHGEAGLGKTFAVAHAMRTHAQVAQCKVEFAARATMKYVATTLLYALTGLEHTGERFALTDELIDVLAQQPRLIVVDEAQRLNHECIEYLRHLWDHPHTTFALALVGGNGCWEVLSRYPMLRSRIYRAVAFSAMRSEDVLAILPGFHRIYRDADRETILFADDHFCHGNFRDWATFTKSAVDICREHEVESLTEDVARFVFALHGGDLAAA